ncbi:DNA-directed RNA polymerase III subunit RPC1-like [Bactrocera neohumeralis]|uniref:DNA-directed RNA polymerase III subunit RPC1-like n=1 Tax=Bactrocera neohumeralis TaxID=98809 RepID=UPI002166BD87|nr:DNA-directed RNA polymerase III subunit RPC1-like [Bactrocera neohumeralis]
MSAGATTAARDAAPAADSQNGHSGGGKLNHKSRNGPHLKDDTTKHRYQLPARFVEKSSQYPVSITAVHYGLLNADDIHRMSELSCRRVINNSQKNYGVNDPHLGVCDRGAVCATCGLKSLDCVGHIGHVDLEAPVFHVGFFSITLRILRTVCKHCARVLLTAEEKESYSRKLRRGPTGALAIEPQQHMAIIKQIQEDAYKTRICMYCGAVNGVVRRVRPMRLVHEKYKVGLRRGEERSEEVDGSVEKELASAMAHNGELQDHLEHVHEILDPVRVRNLFLAIPKEEYHLLGMPGSAEAGIHSLEAVLHGSSGKRPAAATASRQGLPTAATA